MTIASIIVAVLRDPDVRAALREALGSPSDAPVPLAKAAEEIGAPLRALKLAAKRGDLVIEGPRCARVVRRAELDRWLASHRPQPALRVLEGDKRADARASIEAAAARVAGRGRR